MEEKEEKPAQEATEGDRVWRERTQREDPDPSQFQPPPPQGIDPKDNAP
jgi:hypothetical protein